VAEGQIYIAKESFATEYDGVPISVVAGHTRVREGHPLLRGREHLFEPLGVDYEWEQATAAPGEKRGKRSSAKK
jgi:hypothetical protein